jgi:SPP1 gp7 family putative phage head morphogenesis protein
MPMHNARYFTVGPVRELGEDLERAMVIMGGQAQQRFARAHGFVLVEGGRPLRLAAEADLAEAHRHALRDHARLGAAVALAGEQVIYRELAAAPVAKASGQIDPRSPEDFLRIVDQVARALRRATQGAEADAVRQVIDQLDVDWPHLTDADRMRIVRAANEAIASVPPAIMPKVHEVLDLEAGRVVRRTRRSVKQTFSLKISSDFTRTDERIAQFVARSQTNFIRDEYGRRQVAFSEKARQIVSRGIAQGLGRDDISRELRETFRNTAVNRSAFYWDVVASAFVGRARSLVEVSSYAEAGISHYLIVAVLDEVTTDICRFLHGKRFSVGASMAQFARIERLRDPERIKHEQPWLQVRQDRRGNRVIVVPAARGDVRVAVVEDSAERKHAKDERGRFRSGISAAKLETLNVGPPPYHGMCRTQTVPEV